MRAVLELPEEIGILSLRELAPLIAHLRGRHELNIFGMEVLAAALRLPAPVFLSGPSPRLQEALQLDGGRVTIVG